MQFAHFMCFGQQQKWLLLCFKDQMMLNLTDLFCFILCSSWTETLTSHTAVILQLGNRKETRGKAKTHQLRLHSDHIHFDAVFLLWEQTRGSPAAVWAGLVMGGCPASPHSSVLCQIPRQQATAHPARHEGPEPVSQAAPGYNKVQARAEVQGKGTEQRRGHHTALPFLQPERAGRDWPQPLPGSMATSHVAFNPLFKGKSCC